MTHKSPGFQYNINENGFTRFLKKTEDLSSEIRFTKIFSCNPLNRCHTLKWVSELVIDGGYLAARHTMAFKGKLK